MPAPEDNSDLLRAADAIREHEFQRGHDSRDDEVNAALARALRAEQDKAAVEADYAAHMLLRAPAGHSTEDPDPPPPPPARSFPLIFGAAVDNTQTVINDRQQAWGPIKMSRDYEVTKGVGDVTRYPWYSSILRQLADPTDDNFHYLMFSVDNPFATTAAGTDRDDWEALLESLPIRLPGVKGVISVGNETNIESGVNPETYRAAVEKLMDTFGEQPAPGWMWGTAFSNFKSWGQGRTEGEQYLPRRPDMLFAVGTHIYGKDDYTPPEDMLGRSFIPAMNRRPNWIWGVTETSAQEDPQHTRKAAWMTASFNLVLEEGGSMYLPFDTNVGGSADVGSSPQTAAAVKACAQRVASNEWTF